MNIIFIDLVLKGQHSGVNTYADKFVNYVYDREDVDLTILRFTDALEFNHISILEEGRIKVCLIGITYSFFSNPPMDVNDIYENIYVTIKSHIKDNSIISLHFLNLYHFADIIRQNNKNCKIVSHIHCILWKSSYDDDIHKFNHLYKLYYIHKDFDKFKQSFYISQQNDVMNGSDKIITVTYSGEDFIRNIWDNENICTIYNGIEYKETTKEYSDKTNDITIINVSNSTKSKGLHFILEALSLLSTINIKLIVVGNYPVNEQMSLQAIYPGVNVEFKGLLPKTEIEELYKIADIGIISSIHEQCSYVALEMMQAGLPIISTNADGLNEIFLNGVTAVKVPVEFNNTIHVNEVTLSMAIMQLINNPEYRRMLGSVANKVVNKAFKIEDTFEETLSVYKELINN